ncbi:MAG: TIGR02266 family protein [Deltaproteobacteria bacterium]|nr:TIGR02266 family protein [Deltaproteobacteria bacterium]
MVDPNTRQGKRAPVTLKIKFKSATLEQFIERYAVDVSHGGIFIRTKDPLPVGTQMKFEFQLRDATPLITGEATVVWTRENDPARPGVAPGMGVRFDKLGDGSQAVLDKILAEKAKGGDRPPSDTKPPVFNEAPTKVAPSPLVGALANESKPRMGNMAPPRAGFMDERTDTTPLPKPMPFHSDADEFPDEAFEEATKVRSMEELVAATKDIVAPKAKAEKPAPVIEKPAEKPAPVPVIEKPAPAPVAVEKPAPVIEKPAEKPVAEAVPSVKDELAERRAAKSEPTVAEPVKPAEAKAEPAPRISEPRILDHQKPKRADTQPVAKRPETAKPVATATPAPVKPPQPSGGGAPIALILLLVAAVAGAGVWFFVLRKPSTPDAGSGTASAGSGSGSAPDVGSGSPGSGSAGSAGSGVASGSGSAGSGVASGSSGSGSAGSGSAGSGSGSAGVVAAEVADIKITSAIAGAQIDIPDAGVVGEPLPYTAKLDKGKTFKARVSAPGYLGTDVDLVGGGKPVDVKLKAMPHVVHVTSKPAGALIFVDGAPTRRTTPGDVELTAAQAKKGVRIELRKAGFDRYTAPVDIAGFTEKDNTMTTEMVATLVAAKPPAGGGGGGGGGGGNTNPGSGSVTPGSGSSGSGSATPGSGSSGSGSATPGSGSGSATPGSAGSGSAKPGSGSATPGSGSAKPGSGSGSTGAGSGAGSSAGSGSGSSEPTPDWMK